jgi:tetratricopeptide (TPR) repeat protein
MSKHLYTHQQIKKNLKRDELREAIDKLVHFTKGNTENLLIAGILVAVMIILVPLYFRHQAGNELRAANLLDRAMMIYLQPVKDAASTAAGTFKTAAEKYKKAQEAFAEVTGAYPRTKAARWAKLGEANAWFYLKAPEKALAIFQEELAKAPKDVIAPSIQERIAACYVNLQKWAEAQATYEKLLAEFPEYANRRAVRLELARVLRSQNKMEESRKILEEEKNIEPGSYWSEQARRQLAFATPGKP